MLGKLLIFGELDVALRDYDETEESRQKAPDGSRIRILLLVMSIPFDGSYIQPIWGCDGKIFMKPGKLSPSIGYTAR